jgi:hypothetical protein
MGTKGIILVSIIFITSPCRSLEHVELFPDEVEGVSIELRWGLLVATDT